MRIHRCTSCWTSSSASRTGSSSTGCAYRACTLFLATNTTQRLREIVGVDAAEECLVVTLPHGHRQQAHHGIVNERVVGGHTPLRIRGARMGSLVGYFNIDEGKDLWTGMMQLIFMELLVLSRLMAKLVLNRLLLCQRQICIAICALKIQVGLLLRFFLVASGVK
jgi:hypothetical protein